LPDGQHLVDRVAVDRRGGRGAGHRRAHQP
jgi:hypothetical protein